MSFGPRGNDCRRISREGGEKKWNSYGKGKKREGTLLQRGAATVRFRRENLRRCGKRIVCNQWGSEDGGLSNYSQDEGKWGSLGRKKKREPFIFMRGEKWLISFVQEEGEYPRERKVSFFRREGRSDSPDWRGCKTIPPPFRRKRKTFAAKGKKKKSKGTEAPKGKGRKISNLSPKRKKQAFSSRQHLKNQGKGGGEEENP